MIPYTEYERLELLKEIERGEKIVIPINAEHAENMIMVAQKYLDQQRQATFNALTKEYQ